jgi:hypothetical protein
MASSHSYGPTLLNGVGSALRLPATIGEPGFCCARVRRRFYATDVTVPSYFLASDPARVSGAPESDSAFGSNKNAGQVARPALRNISARNLRRRVACVARRRHAYALVDIVG